MSAVADPPARTDLGRVAARGAGVTLAGQGARILLQLASVAVLARLLGPADYGLLAVGLVVVGIGEVFRDLGLSTAAIRTPDLTTRQRDGLFWLNVAAGTALAAVALLASGSVAAAFGEPELADIVRWLSSTFLLNGLAAQYRAGLIRELRFGAVAGVDLGAQLVAFGVAVTAAVAGAGYWALVAQQLTQGAVALVLVVALGRWVPGRPRRGVGLWPLVRFGSGLTGTQLVYYVGNNLDNLVLGLTAGPAALGIYNRGFQLLMTPLNQLRSPATTVAVPVLSRLQDDLERSGEYLRRSQLALGFSLVAGMALAAGAAGPLVDLLLGDRWAQVAPVLALLAVAGSAQTLSFVGLWVYLSRGLSGALFRYTVVTLVLSAACIGAGSLFGVVGVAAGYATAALLEWPLSLWWLSRVTVLPVRDLYLGALRVTACAVTAGSACLAATQLTAGWPSAGRLAAGLLAGLAAYGLAALVPVVRRDLAGVVAWGRQMVARRG
ncbi:lipopolysaccharide biosynthesis protein [Geodermatophilus sp. DSM 45219]|uniref:lipopolysaccharide biosynthesis protein n=1 Tax=Geodermatophilus sp. DSM 45219 TaxID=1881103 RepID=UPI00087EA27E|nr:lipopolysaccharide biosynthesis protein [Geodermatophilus sp. DSM 45219]SDN45300.1 polysaccharide transporter, PST family [Geodermatophilus sp. DSM 45219]